MAAKVGGASGPTVYLLRVLVTIVYFPCSSGLTFSLNFSFPYELLKMRRRSMIRELLGITVTERSGYKPSSSSYFFKLEIWNPIAARACLALTSLLRNFRYSQRIMSTER